MSLNSTLSPPYIYRLPSPVTHALVSARDTSISNGQWSQWWTIIYGTHIQTSSISCSLPVCLSLHYNSVSHLASHPLHFSTKPAIDTIPLPILSDCLTATPSDWHMSETCWQTVTNIGTTGHAPSSRPLIRHASAALLKLYYYTVDRYVHVPKLLIIPTYISSRHTEPVCYILY